MLAGGHAGLVKVLFNAWLTEGEPQSPLVSHFAEHPGVQAEWQRIMDGFHRDEQQAIIALARDPHPTPDKDMLRHLVHRGVLTSADPVKWFSPLIPVIARNSMS